MTQERERVLTLTQANALRDAAFENLEELGRRVHATLFGSDLEEARTLSKIVFKVADPSLEDDSHCIDFHDMHGGCVSYCDPPGVCKPCDGVPSSSGLGPVFLTE